MSDSILQVNLIKNKGGSATGITIDNSNANVTIGNLTATSLAGGTIASAVTFPAGHVLQVQQNYVTNSNTTVTSTGNLSNITNSYYTFTWGVDITTKQANSKIALIGHLGNAHLASGHSNAEVNLSILRYKGGVKEAFVGNTQAGYSSGGPSYGLSRITALNNGEKAPAISFLDAPADAAGTVLQYRFACMTLSGGFNIQSGTSSSLMAMEIAV